MSERFYEIFGIVAANIMGLIMFVFALILGGAFQPKDKDKNKKAS